MIYTVQDIDAENYMQIMLVHEDKEDGEKVWEMLKNSRKENVSRFTT